MWTHIRVPGVTVLIATSKHNTAHNIPPYYNNLSPACIHIYIHTCSHCTDLLQLVDRRSNQRIIKTFTHFSQLHIQSVIHDLELSARNVAQQGPYLVAFFISGLKSDHVLTRKSLKIFIAIKSRLWCLQESPTHELINSYPFTCTNICYIYISILLHEYMYTHIPHL